MPNVLQRTNSVRSSEVTPFVQVPNTNTKTKTNTKLKKWSPFKSMSPLAFALQLPRLFLLSHLSKREGSKGAAAMASFTQEQASAITYTIRTLRPGWAYGAVMKVLEGYSLEGKPVADVVTACFRAAQDPKAMAPTAIMWEQFWVKSGGKADNGLRLCAECLTRKPVGHMATQQPPFICTTCHDG